MSIPILIPMKRTSLRCHNKNFILFPFIIQSLKKYIDDVVILTEDIECIDFVKYYNVKTWLYDNKYTNETNICYNYCILNDIQHFFLFPLTQPFKDLSFIDNSINFINDYDVICSSIKTSDRSRFYINDNRFQMENVERKGILCNEYEMVDGSMYLISTKFLATCIENDTISNYKFWNSGRLKTINCVHPYLDIDTEDDMKQFMFLLNYFNKF